MISRVWHVTLACAIVTIATAVHCSFSLRADAESASPPRAAGAVVATTTPYPWLTDDPMATATSTPVHKYLPYLSQRDVLKTPTFTPTPTATSTPRPTATRTPRPSMADVHVNNQTGGELCYEIRDTAIGRRCFSGGTHYYGSFAAGTYSWKASARGGSASGSKYYASGRYVHNFWCTMAAALGEEGRDSAGR